MRHTLRTRRAVPTILAASALALAGCGAPSAAETRGENAAALNVRSVCASGCAYALPSEALAAAVDGDTIEVAAGTYTDCMYITKNNITVTGVGGVPAMTGRVCGQKGIIVTAGRDMILKNLELYGATDSENYAGIRHDAAGYNLTLDNVYVHDNDDGILSSSVDDTVLITNSRFERNGMNNPSGLGHNLYIGRSASVTFRSSQSLRAKLTGHELKSRAARTVIDASVIATLDGQDSRAIDISEGGEVIVRGSVLQKSPGSDNSDMIGYGGEGLRAGLNHSFTMDGGTQILDDKGRGPVVNFMRMPGTISITGNTAVEPGALSNAGAPGSNAIFASRSAAGYQPYPWLPPVTGSVASPPPPDPSPPPSGWADCARENQFCAFSGTMQVRYGAGSTWTTQTLTGGVDCTNAVFGDPLVGVAKSCQISAPAANPAPPPAPSPSGWTACARENQFCAFSGTMQVRYGAGSTWTTQTLTGGVDCTNAVFGDPVVGVAKSCEISPPPATWTFCASENQSCAFAGTQSVRYGAGSVWTTRTFTGGVACTNAVFGDPVPGTVKSCEVSP